MDPKMMIPSVDNILRAIDVKGSNNLPVSILIRYANGCIIAKTIGPMMLIAKIVYRIINSKYALWMIAFNLGLSFFNSLITYYLVPHAIDRLYMIWFFGIDF